MEAYGNSTVSVLEKFYAFLRWKGRVYKQLFCTSQQPMHHRIYSSETVATLWECSRPFYSVEASRCSSRFQGKSQAKPTQPKTDLNQSKMHGDSSHHLRNARNWCGEAVSFHSVVSLQGATSRHAIEETGHP